MAPAITNKATIAALPPMRSVTRPATGDSTAAAMFTTASTTPNSARLIERSSMMNVARMPSDAAVNVAAPMARNRSELNANRRVPTIGVATQ